MEWGVRGVEDGLVSGIVIFFCGISEEYMFKGRGFRVY